MVDRIHNVQAVGSGVGRGWGGVGERENNTKVCENCEKSLPSCVIDVRF
jgi:hypothetical protein